jgi:hypothetical protein
VTKLLQCLTAASALLCFPAVHVGGVEKALAAAEKLLDSPGKQAGGDERRVLRGKLDPARGDAKAAYERLRVLLHRWGTGAEGYAVLAIAAHLTGHDRLAEQALERAERRSVDVRALGQRRGRVIGPRGK